MSLLNNIIIMIFLLLISFISLTIYWNHLQQQNIQNNNSLKLLKEYDELLKVVNDKRDKLSNLVKDATLHNEENNIEQQIISNNNINNNHNNNLQQEQQEQEQPSSQKKSLFLSKATNHAILSLDDIQFENTKLSEMIKWYSDRDTISGSGYNCPSDFGNALVDRWRNTRKTYCDTKSDSSSIDCFPVKQTRHYGGGDNLCILKDISMNVGLFGNDEVVTPVIETYVQTVHEVLPYIHYPKGFIRSTCQQNPTNFIKDTLPGWNYDLVMGGLENIQSLDLSSNLYSCEKWIDHNVLIIQRDTFANFFHDSEDFVNTFLAMAILEWSRADTQILLTDLFPQGPFWDMWSRVYSTRNNPSKKVMTAWDLRTKYGHDLNSRVCFRNAAVGIYGPAAPITVASWRTPCHRTALIRAYSDFVIRGLGLQEETHYAKEKPEKTITITYMARRAYSEWPEKRFCNDTGSFFKCKYWAHMGGRTIGRMISNDAEFAARLKKLEIEKPGGINVKITEADFNKLSFEDQIRIDLQTDILIGAHGAGLTHNVFMRDRAVLIELNLAGSSMAHFHNLAHWYGREYVSIDTGNPIDIDEVINHIKQVIISIDLNSY